MASRAVGEVINGQMEVLSVGQSLDKRSGQTMLKTRVRFTSGPFKGIETLVKHPVSDNKKGSKSTAKSTASKPASKGAAKSTGKAAKSTASKAPAKGGSKGKATKVQPAEPEPDDDDALDLDFEDDEE